MEKFRSIFLTLHDLQLQFYMTTLFPYLLTKDPFHPSDETSYSCEAHTTINLSAFKVIFFLRQWINMSNPFGIYLCIQGVILNRYLKVSFILFSKAHSLECIQRPMLNLPLLVVVPITHSVEYSVSHSAPLQKKKSAILISIIFHFQKFPLHHLVSFLNLSSQKQPICI